VEAVRRTLDYELHQNERLVVFGEDVGAKGGVHAATMGLQTTHGDDRVFDTSLSEEGIIGRAVGLAYTGLMPVAEIQFRKYADPATEQLKNCGTIRWRTANKFAAPMVVRMPGGFAKCGDPWHSESNEVFFSRMIGWNVAYPSNAEDVVGLLRSAMRGNDPVIFFEHRNLLDAKSARKPYPGDEYVLPFGKASHLREGDDLTIVTWGAMCERCVAAAESENVSADIIDLRTLSPWDQEAVFESVKKTNRCLIVHEDTQTAGFGSEISSSITENLFRYLDAPVQRLAMPDIPMPYNVKLMNSVLPDKNSISDSINKLINF
jgi:2-oxoisovalerate dehydrogenase E1 component